jgi:hypothetical protein
VKLRKLLKRVKQGKVSPKKAERTIRVDHDQDILAAVRRFEHIRQTEELPTTSEVTTPDRDLEKGVPTPTPVTAADPGF